jgi:prepilin-type N-terminal cleavage/methylation domain-containing protein
MLKHLKMTAIKPRGFTIVELLIVIVVIAILAAITMVAYNGIQTRTENTKTAQAVSQYSRIIQMYATTYGVYPTSVSPPTPPASSYWTCMPYSPAYCGSSDNNPAPCLGMGYTTKSAGFENELKKVASTLPAVSEKASDCSSTQTFQGALIHVYNSGMSAQLFFPQIGNLDCPAIGGTTFTGRNFAVNTTRCQVSLPDLQ